MVQEEKGGQSASPAAPVQETGSVPLPSSTEPPEHIATPVDAGSPLIEAAHMPSSDAEPGNATLESTGAQSPPQPSKMASDSVDIGAEREQSEEGQAQKIQEGQKDGGSKAGGVDDGDAVPAKIIGRLGLPAVYVPPSGEEQEPAQARMEGGREA